MPAFNALSTDELTALANRTPHELIGVERSEETLEWIWDNFSAVAGDHPAFESYRKSLSISVSLSVPFVPCPVVLFSTEYQHKPQVVERLTLTHGNSPAQRLPLDAPRSPPGRLGLSDRRAFRLGEAGGGVRAAEAVVVLRNQRSVQCSGGSSQVRETNTSSLRMNQANNNVSARLSGSPPNILAIF